MAAFIAFPLHDVCRPFTTGMAERGSFPARVLGPVQGESDDQLVARLERIDYVMVSPELAVRCTAARVCNGVDNWLLSDHYPVVAEFDIRGLE
jgi:endonuclease/exonuclease/phosphatase family metal-dependent hydrolase